MRIDHVIYASGDLSSTVRRFEKEYGLEAGGGGVHPRLGTRNSLVPVGGRQYIELMAVAEPGASFLAVGVAEVLTTGERPFAVSIEPDDLDATASRLGLQITEGERRSTSGRVLRWRSAGLREAAGPSHLPFFVDWGDSDPDLPSLNSDVDGVAWMELGGDEDHVRRWLGDGRELPLRFSDGPTGPLALGLRRGSDIVVIR